MKVDTQNYLWQDFTHSSLCKNTLNKRLFIFTGKGGTGKSSLALAWCSYLKSKKKKVLFNNLGQTPETKVLNNLKIPFTSINTKVCMQAYMAKKLNSEIISKWIMDTNFFKSLFNIIPSLGYIAYLGHIIQLLEENKKLHIIIDAEASGHALTMLESPFNFKKIFLSGVLMDDLDIITQYLTNESLTALFTISNPTPMSVNENCELINKLQIMGIKGIIPLINNSFNKLNLKEVPDFLNKKIILEKKSIQSYGKIIPPILSHQLSVNHLQIVKMLKKELGEMIFENQS